MMKSLEFLNLPVEIICHILGFLEASDLIQCTILSKRLRKVVMESSRLQYTLELAKHRMVSLSPPTTMLSYVSRLKLLRDREQAWKSLTWNARYNLKLPPTGSVYEFVGGFYGNGKEDEHRKTASISFLELPDASSAQRNGLSDLKMWTHPMTDVTIIDFTMDPSQDLLVLIALATAGSGYVYELHLRSLTSNRPHPKAPFPVLSCLLKPSHTHQTSEHMAAVRVQVSGDLVALLVKEVHDSIGAHLEIWDWINNPQFSCKMARISGIDDFTFLSQDSFLLVRPTGNFEVYTFQNPMTGSVIPICQASYKFPPLSEGYMYWYITMSSNPAPGSIPRPTDETNFAQGSSKQTYYPQPNERIHACCLYIFNPSTEDHDHRVHCFVFFLNINTLLNPPPEWAEDHNLIIRGGEPSSDTDTESTISNSDMPAEAHGPSSSSQAHYALPHPEYLYSPITQSLNSPSNLPSMPFPTQASVPSHSLQPFALGPAPAPPKQTRRNGVPIQTPADIPWSVWGPQSTRWFRECLSTDWQHAIYGLRTIESVKVEKLLNRSEYKSTENQEAHKSQDLVDAQTEIETGSASQMNGEIGETIPEGQATLNGGDEDDNGEGEEGNELPVLRRVLRLRDFNPYSVMRSLEEENTTSKKGKNKINWKTPRIVTEPSVTNVKGIFKHDVTSWLPYVEVVSEEIFDVTDVMMDDCRLLLLRRGLDGKLRRVDVLTM